MHIQDHRMCRLCNRFLQYELLDILSLVFVNEIGRTELLKTPS